MLENQKKLTDLQKEIVKILQEDIPLVSDPFGQMADSLKISREEFLKETEYLLKAGYMRRMGAVLAHRKLGLNYNPMVVIQAKEEDLEDLGQQIASLPEVTHCYRRPRFEDFPYDLYAMVHSKTEEAAKELAKKITNDDRITSYKLLYSSKEYKKTSMKYFI